MTIQMKGQATGRGHDSALEAFDTLKQFLESENLEYERIEDLYVFRVRYPGKFTPLRCYAEIDVKREQFTFFVSVPILVAEGLRLAVAEYLTRVNYGLRIGNFEMDLGDGEIRYKSSLDFKGEKLTTGWIRNAVIPAVGTMDRYIPGVVAIIDGGKTPVEALEKIEGTDRG